MEELKKQRGYYRRVFKHPTKRGQLKARLFVAPIFYYNKLKVGDGEERFRQVDPTLVWDETKRAWGFLYNNFHPIIPEYADEWGEFRDVFKEKDQTIRMRAIAAHVKGRLEPQGIPGATNGYPGVVYENAFGEGKDLIVHPNSVGLRKLVRVREAYKGTADLAFDFEIELPEMPAQVQEENPKREPVLTAGAALGPDIRDKKAAIELTSQKRLIIGDVQKTFLRPVRVWDSGVPGDKTGQKVELGRAEIVTENKKRIFRKHISAAFLQGTVGDVFTDDVTTIQEDKDTYYGTVFTTGGAPDATTLNVGGWGDFYYSYIEWDLTGSPSAAEATECLLSLRVNGVAANDNVGTIRRVTESWTEAGVTNASHPADDATTWAALTNPVTIGAGNRDEKDIIALYDAWKDGTYTNYGIKIHSTGNNNAAHTYSSSDDATEANRPYLEITYAPLTVVSDSVTEQAGATAVANGEVTEDQGVGILRRGFVYDTSSHADPGDTDPDVSDYPNVEDESPAGNPVIVQKGSETLAAGTSSVTIDLDTPVEVGKAFPIVTMRSNAYQTSRTLAVAVLQTVVDGHYTQLLIQRSFSTNTECVYQWQVLECQDFTVQTGEASMNNLTEADVTITDIDQSKAFAVIYSRTNNTGATAAYVRGKFTSDTNLRLNCGVAATSMQVRWYVVEWEGATVQAGEQNFDGTELASGIRDVTISSVDRDHAFVLFSASMVNFSTNAGIISTQATLTSSTNLRLYKRLYYPSGEFGTVCWFVISHPNINVQYGSGNQTDDVYLQPLTAIDEARTFAASYHIGNGNCNTNANLTNHHTNHTHEVVDISGTKYFRGQRSVTDNSFYPAWFIVEDQIVTFGAEAFSLDLSGLTPGSTYYLRAFAQNENGFAYGDEIRFPENRARLMIANA